MDNVTILDNPFSEGILISSRGCMTDAKIAKLNNAEKRPTLEKKWEAAKMKIMSAALGVKDVVVVNSSKLSELLTNLSMTLVNYAKEAINNGAKKLRVNGIVKIKAKNVYDNLDKIDVIPMVSEKPQEEVKSPLSELVSEVTKDSNPLEPKIVSSREDIHGRHEHTGEIPVAEIQEAIKNDVSPNQNKNVSITSRVERNAANNAAVEQDMKIGDTNIYSSFETKSKAGDPDVIFNKLHQTEQEGDMSRQLQGAHDRVFEEEAKNKEISKQLRAYEEEYQALAEKKAQAKKMQEQKQKEEIEKLNNTAKLLEEDTLEKTNNLLSLKTQIAALKEELQAFEEQQYDDANSRSRAA